MDIKEYKRQYYLKNREKILERSKNRNKNNKADKKIYDREYRIINKEQIVERNRIWRQKNPKMVLAALHRNRAKNPEGDRARHILNYHIEKKEIARPSICTIDGCDRTDVQGHHEDYFKPLEVLWVCCKHHHEIHRKVS